MQERSKGGSPECAEPLRFKDIGARQVSISKFVVALEKKEEEYVGDTTVKPVKIFTLKKPTLIIKEYISTRFKEERDPYEGTGSEIYIIKKVTRKRTQRPIIGSSIPNTNQSDSRFRYC